MTSLAHPTLRAFDAADATAHAAWRDAWASWPGRDPAAHPSYAALFAGAGARAVGLLYDDATGRVLLPLVVRPVTGPGGEGLVDLVTPYGYGGAFRDGEPDAARFWDAFDAWAAEAGAVSLAARLSLFDDELIPFRGTTIHVMDNVVRTLDASPEALFESYEYKVRKNVRRAEREGLRVEIDDTPARFEAFYRIYGGTMERRAAGAGFHFPRAFFETIHRELAGGFVYAHVIRDGAVVSSELVLASTTRLYSFLGGTDAEHFPLRPNDLLKHEVIAWGARRGYHAYVLGGGPAPGDGIFRYKRSFAPEGVRPFRLGTRVLRPDVYERLVADRRAAEAHAGRDWQPSPTYFPSYRAP